MEGHCACLRYLVEQLVNNRQSQPSPQCAGTGSGPHPVLDVRNNLGETARALAQRFYKHDTVKTIDRLLTAQLTESSQDIDGTAVI